MGERKRELCKLWVISFAVHPFITATHRTYRYNTLLWDARNAIPYMCIYSVLCKELCMNITKYCMYIKI